MHPDNHQYLGVDVGSTRIGIARGSGGARLAEPLLSVTAKEAIDRLSDLVGKYQASGIVVGLPRGLDGQETAQTRDVKQWAEQVKRTIGLKYYWQDEAMTSQAAASKIQASKSKNQNADEHALAAAIILQDFLDTPVKNRVSI